LDLTKNLTKKVIFPRGKYWKHLYFQSFLLMEVFTFYSGFFISLMMHITKKPHVVLENWTNLYETTPATV
jgi:hypothetical protein